MTALPAVILSGKVAEGDRERRISMAILRASPPTERIVPRAVPISYFLLPTS
jgi:hypothetical protein